VPAGGERCVTVTVTVDGVNRRIQARVTSQSPIFVSPFGQAGLIGKSLVYAWNSVNLYSSVGSNAEVNFTNSVNVFSNPGVSPGSVLLLTGGTYTVGTSVTVQGDTPPPYETVPFDVPAIHFEDWENTNDNASLPLAIFNQTTRRLVIPSGDYTIEPGTYHVCSVFLGSSVRLRLSNADDAPTRILVDSPARAGSPCVIGDGTFGADNSVEIKKQFGEREELLEVHMYGTGLEDTRVPYAWCTPSSPALPGECTSDFMLDNSVEFYGTVFAPTSSVGAHNSAKIFGGAAADKIRFYNSVEFKPSSETTNKQVTIGLTGPASRRGWTECRSAPTVPSDPESGCS
jgi:hypothetical protein